MRLSRYIFVLLTIAIVSIDGPAMSHSDNADISQNDEKILKAAFTAVSKNNWKSARSLAAKLKDPLARKIVRFFDLERQQSKASFRDVSSFITDNPHWPSMKTLRRRAEEAMQDDLSPDHVLAWLDGKDPASTEGWVQLARALVASGEEETAQSVIREIWINKNFAKRPEKTFYKRYRKYLRAEDHVKRLDRLLWEGRNWPARRMMWKVKPGMRALAEARLMLRHRFGNVDTAIKKVPEELLNDPGLAYERLRWRRKKGRYEQSLELLMPPPDNLVRPDLWWQERASLARMALQKGHITDAYRLVHEHKLKEGPGFADAEWLSGWIALRFMNEPKTAFTHFTTMYEYVNYPISRARGAYWAARAATAMGNAETADMWFRIAAKLPTTYYGQLAAARLSAGHGLLLPVQPGPEEGESKEFHDLDLVRAIQILDSVGEKDRLKPFILALNNYRDTTGWHTLSAKLAGEYGRPDVGISIAKKSSRQGAELIEVGYPSVEPPKLRTRSSKYALEVPLVLAMIRQESAFFVGAKSHANARGLMQILPRTAKKVAHGLKIKFSKNRLTTDPNYNMTLGQTYLAGLIDEFNGSYVLALAGYNAGPGRARKWAKLNGNPRERTIDTIDWIEMIPFTETRNYVQRVLENLQIYRLKMADTEVAESLDQDLVR
ncbi:MAG: lytic transglycosylase domain-containing protein [Rhodospirillales bacterium]|nr:lytic transglycosylase domain-containing protein [Rhodospirillales bacterium]